MECHTNPKIIISDTRIFFHYLKMFIWGNLFIGEIWDEEMNKINRIKGREQVILVSYILLINSKPFLPRNVPNWMQMAVLR